MVGGWWLVPPQLVEMCAGHDGVPGSGFPNVDFLVKGGDKDHIGWKGWMVSGEVDPQPTLSQLNTLQSLPLLPSLPSLPSPAIPCLQARLIMATQRTGATPCWYCHHTVCKRILLGLKSVTTAYRTPNRHAK